VVVEIDVCCLTPAAVPFENEPPLLVDADRVKFRQLATQFFEMIAWGTRKSRSVAASSIIWSLRNTRLSKSGGMLRERTSSTKNARNQSSRKPTIIPASSMS
jgi:hypothetical protein